MASIMSGSIKNKRIILVSILFILQPFCLEGMKFPLKARQKKADPAVSSSSKDLENGWVLTPNWEREYNNLKEQFAQFKETSDSQIATMQKKFDELKASCDGYAEQVIRAGSQKAGTIKEAVKVSQEGTLALFLIKDLKKQAQEQSDLESILNLDRLIDKQSSLGSLIPPEDIIDTFKRYLSWCKEYSRPVRSETVMRNWKLTLGLVMHEYIHREIGHDNGLLEKELIGGLTTACEQKRFELIPPIAQQAIIFCGRSSLDQEKKEAVWRSILTLLSTGADLPLTKEILVDPKVDSTIGAFYFQSVLAEFLIKCAQDTKESNLDGLCLFMKDPRIGYFWDSDSVGYHSVWIEAFCRGSQVVRRLLEADLQPIVGDNEHTVRSLLLQKKDNPEWADAVKDYQIKFGAHTPTVLRRKSINS